MRTLVISDLHANWPGLDRRREAQRLGLPAPIAWSPGCLLRGILS